LTNDQVTNTNEYISEYTTTNNHDIIDIKYQTVFTYCCLNFLIFLIIEWVDYFDCMG